MLPVKDYNPTSTRSIIVPILIGINVVVFFFIQPFSVGATSGAQQLEQQFITEYFLDNETNAAQADFLARSQLYEGDYREADRFVDELKSVTPEAVQRVARRYMKGFRFAYVGDPSKLDPRTISLF